MATEKLWTGFDNTKIMAERAVCDEVGQNIVDTYATKAEVTEKQDALPSSAANQFLQTNANNEITWGTLPEALDKVYIVTYGSSVSVNTVSAERQAGKAVFCSKGNALLPLQAIGSNICSFNGVIGAENSTGMNGLIMAHVELMATGMWGYSTISIPKPTGTSKTLTIDTDGTVAWTATPVIPQEMTGATAQGAGASGLVPAPTAGDQAKFLKGDGTWATPPEANLANYYYDDRGNGLSAKRANYDSPYGTTSLVGGHGNMNDYTIDATFWIDWGGIARNFFSVNTYDPGASRIGFGNNSTNARAMRYLLPTPVANKYAKTDANGQITWGDVPSLPSPTINDSLLLGQADGSETWTALENDVFGTDQLWTGFAGKGFGAIRAYADQDGNNIKATYATKTELDGVAAGLEDALDTLNDTMETVAHAGMYDLGHKDESKLETGNILAISCGNSNTELALTTVSTLTVLANPGVANFALLVDNSGNSNDVTVTVKDSTDTDTFLYSSAAGNQVKKNTICQITCVGRCWTLAEFEAPA